MLSSGTMLRISFAVLALPFYCRTWNDGDLYGVADDSVTVQFVEDAKYVNILDIAPFVTVRHELMEWTMACSDWEACLDLSEPRLAVPQLELTSPSCPSRMLVDKLLALGFEQVDRTIIHRDNDLKFDGEHWRLVRVSVICKRCCS